MGNAAIRVHGVMNQARKSTNLMMRAVTTALKSKQRIEDESKPRPDPQAAITEKLIAYGARNKRPPTTFVDDEDAVEELSKETGLIQNGT